MTEEYIYTKRNDEEILISNLTDEHLLNTIKFIKRKAKEGMHIYYASYDPDDIRRYDSETIYGIDVEIYLNLLMYIEEAKKRGLIKLEELLE